MELNTILLIGAVALGLVSTILCIVLLARRGGDNELQRQLAERQDERIRELTGQLAQSQGNLQSSVAAGIQGLDRRISDFGAQNEQKLENIRQSVNNQMAAMQQGNEKKLEEMRRTVDEKLQSTLEARLKQSFSLVNEGLSQVHKGLGEMQTLAASVGDLKKVMANVKTRGILGEIQLAAILEDILSPGQYAANVATVKGSAERVEFAVKLPGETPGETVWLPIDAKFPADAYAALLDAYESGSAEAVNEAGTELDKRIRGFAKDIHTKYVRVPETTEFAVMFLPVEGLYSEVVRRGLVEKLQSEFRVNIAGPTTMAALLNSLQMGFRTLAIQKRSGEVWKVLGEVKSEFAKFGQGLGKAKENIDRAGRQIDDLMGVRTRQIQRRLRDVETMPSPEEMVARGDYIPEAPAVAEPRPAMEDAPADGPLAANAAEVPTPAKPAEESDQAVFELETMSAPELAQDAPLYDYRDPGQESSPYTGDTGPEQAPDDNGHMVFDLTAEPDLGRFTFEAPAAGEPVSEELPEGPLSGELVEEPLSGELAEPEGLETPPLAQPDEAPGAWQADTGDEPDSYPLEEPAGQE